MCGSHVPCSFFQLDLLWNMFTFLFTSVVNNNSRWPWAVFTGKQKAKNLHECLHVRFARRRNGRREFKSKFGVRSGVHLSVHLGSIMRSAESSSREKHLIAASFLRASVAFRKEAKSLFSRGSEGKPITSAQTPGRNQEVPERTEMHGQRHCDALKQTYACHPLSPHHIFLFQLFNSCDTVKVCFTSVVVAHQNQWPKSLDTTFRAGQNMEGQH